MTTAEWNACDCPPTLLWKLRGEVSDPPVFGPCLACGRPGELLYQGNSQFASIEKCRRFGQICIEYACSFTGKSKNHVIGNVSTALVDDPYEAAMLTEEIAWIAADIVAEESVKISCADAKEEDRLIWGWGIGPPDSNWQIARQRMRKGQADILRQVFKYPDAQQHAS